MRFASDSVKVNTAALLQTSRLFGDFTSKEIASLLPEINPVIKDFKAGEIIQKENSISDRVGLVLQGTVSGIRRAHCSRGHELCYRRTGDTIGLFGFFSEEKKSFVEISALNDVRILFFDIVPLLENIQTGDRILLAACAEAIRLTRQDIMRMDALLSDSSQERIDIFLRDRMDENGIVSLNFSQEETARYLNINRTTFSRELSSMKKNGTLEELTKRKFIYHGNQKETM